MHLNVDANLKQLFLPHSAMPAQCHHLVSVCLSVCYKSVFYWKWNGKWLNIWSHKQHHTIV